MHVSLCKIGCRFLTCIQFPDQMSQPPRGLSQLPYQTLLPLHHLSHERFIFLLTLRLDLCLSTCHLPVSQARERAQRQQGHCRCSSRPPGSPEKRAWHGGVAGSTCVDSVTTPALAAKWASCFESQNDNNKLNWETKISSERLSQPCHKSAFPAGFTSLAFGQTKKHNSLIPETFLHAFASSHPCRLGNRSRCRPCSPVSSKADLQLLPWGSPSHQPVPPPPFSLLSTFGCWHVHRHPMCEFALADVLF